jgi:hypothetical protein
MADTTDGPMVFDESQFPAVLYSPAKSYGGISRMARRFGVDASNLNKACKGKLPPSRKLLNLIGATQKRVYEIPRVKNYLK